MAENTGSRPQKNHLIHFVKGVAALGVVLVHFQFPGVLGKVLCSIGVCGVVFFFLVSGYFAFDPDDKSACRKLMKRFKRNLILTLIAVAVYAVYTVIEQFALGTFGEWLGHFKNPWLLPRMIVMGDFEFIHGDPLWFMPALLYTYLILYLLHKAGISRYAYIALPLLLLLRIGMETYTNSFGADWHLSGNFLAGGLPIMLLGHYIACKKDSFLKSPLYLTVSYSVFAAALMFVTVNVPVFGIDVSQIFKIWCAVEIFLLAICLPEKRGIPFIEQIGEKYSLYIYLSHYLIGTLFLVVLAETGTPAWVQDWLLPIAVILVSVLVSAVMCAVKGKKANTR